MNSDDFKGQKGQDRWVVDEVYQGRRNGYFVDLAAADGVLHSNSYVLEKCLDWKGLCIEPNPEFFEKLVSIRGCDAANCVISDIEEEVEFRTDNGQLGGVVADDTDNNESVRGDELKNATIINLKAVNINKLFEQYNVPKFIDYFSLDVEGCEERIIGSLDFNTYEFGCITVERPTPEVNRVLLEAGYIFVKNYKFDSFYIHPNVQATAKLQCDPFEQIPPKDW